MCIITVFVDFTITLLIRGFLSQEGLKAAVETFPMCQEENAEALIPAFWLSLSQEAVRLYFFLLLSPVPVVSFSVHMWMCSPPTMFSTALLVTKYFRLATLLLQLLLSLCGCLLEPCGRREVMMQRCVYECVPSFAALSPIFILCSLLAPVCGGVNGFTRSWEVTLGTRMTSESKNYSLTSSPCLPTRPGLPVFCDGHSWADQALHYTNIYS